VTSSHSCVSIDVRTSQNFMIRDEKMQQLVTRAKEPITPFIAKIRCMHAIHRVSSILVIGGCGAYFAVADNVLMMDCYFPKNVTKSAKSIIAKSNGGDIEMKQNSDSGGGMFQFKEFGSLSNRVPNPRSISAMKKGRVQFRVVRVSVV